MPVYQLKCQSCYKHFEVVCPVDDRNLQTCDCGGTAMVIPAVHGPNCSSDSANWIKTVLEVVDKDSRKPHVVQFLKYPTRDNYRKWMKGEGIRHLEPGEKRKFEELDLRRHTDKVMEMRQERNRIEIR